MKGIVLELAAYKCLVCVLGCLNDSALFAKKNDKLPSWQEARLVDSSLTIVH
jgi:hypothetical protein